MRRLVFEQLGPEWVLVIWNGASNTYLNNLVSWIVNLFKLCFVFLFFRWLTSPKGNQTILQLRERLSYKSVKVFATKNIMGSVSLPLLDWQSQSFSMTEGETTNTCIWEFSFYHTEIPWISINQQLTDTTHNSFWHCRAHFDAFVGQPFSKQLYTIYRWNREKCTLICRVQFQKIYYYLLLG